MPSTSSNANKPRKGERTRREILAVAADLASASGLEGISIGDLAKTLEMSKSGLYAHFASKEALQLAVVDLARRRFEEIVFPPAEPQSIGLSKLWVLLMSWIDSIEQTHYRGGCFFAAASAEFDDRPGPVRDELIRLMKIWVQILTDQIETAICRKELKQQTDPKQLVFEIHGLVQEANWYRQLLGEGNAFHRSRNGIRSRLKLAVTRKGQSQLSKFQTWEIQHVSE